VSTAPEPLVGWLSRQRRTNELQLEVMAQYFDLDGAIASHQPELAWRARECLVVVAVELYLRARDVCYDNWSDRPGRTATLLAALSRIDPALGDKAWELVLAPLPATDDARSDGIRRTLDLLGAHLDLPAASRNEAIRVWADGVRVLREIARWLGLAQSDGWYLTGESAAEDQLDWYDEVISQLAEEPA
jgi:hypothetical protein